MSKALLSVLLVAAIAVAVSAFLDGNFMDNDENIQMIYTGNRPTYDQTQFIGKNILVTGGSSGIGFATAMTFARFGAHVYIVSRDSNPDWFTGLLSLHVMLSCHVLRRFFVFFFFMFFV